MENQEIVLKEANGEMTMDTRDVARMMETEHSEILKKLEGTTKSDGSVKQVGIIPVFRKGNIPVSEFFIESSYKTTDNNKTYKCYLCTKKGCEVLANKFTGEKGILFTARYVDAFNKMELALKQTSENKTLTAVEDKKLITEIKNTLDEFKRATMVLTHKDKLDLTKHIIHPILELYAVKSEYKKEVTKIVKENLFVNGKWENIRIDDNFNRVEFKEEVRNTVEIIKQNNPLFFKNAEYETISMFD